MVPISSSASPTTTECNCKNSILSLVSTFWAWCSCVALSVAFRTEHSVHISKQKFRCWNFRWMYCIKLVFLRGHTLPSSLFHRKKTICSPIIIETEMRVFLLVTLWSEIFLHETQPLSKQPGDISRYNELILDMTYLWRNVDSSLSTQYDHLNWKHVLIWNIFISAPESRSRWPRGIRRRSWPLGYWYRGFESRSRHECLFLCLCVALSCVGRGLYDGLINRPEESYRVSK
jgi:hypothetical protein